jgi:DNA-binding FrmR family transcriptional regulator
MKLQSEKAKSELTRRLRRIEGQMRGIQGMVDDGRDCREIVQQLNAAAAAMRNATQFFMRAYAKECLMDGETLDRLQAQGVVDELMDLMAQVK